MTDQTDKTDAEERAALARKQHTRRIQACVDAGFIAPGLRLSNPANGHEDGCVVKFDDGEQAVIMEAVKKVLAARQ